MVPIAIVRPVYKHCSGINHHVNQTSPLTQIIPVSVFNSVHIYGAMKQCDVYICNVQMSL